MANQINNLNLYLDIDNTGNVALSMSANDTSTIYKVNLLTTGITNQITWTGSDFTSISGVMYNSQSNSYLYGLPSNLSGKNYVVDYVKTGLTGDRGDVSNSGSNQQTSSLIKEYSSNVYLDLNTAKDMMDEKGSNEMTINWRGETIANAVTLTITGLYSAVAENLNIVRFGSVLCEKFNESSNDWESIETISYPISSIQVPVGTELRLTAIAETGYIFNDFTVADDNINSQPYNSPCVLTITEDIVLRASFTPDASITTYTITITGLSNGNTVEMLYSEGEEEYSFTFDQVNYSKSVQAGSKINLVAVPYTNYEFVQWSTGSTDREYSIISINSSLTLGVTFTQQTIPSQTYRLAISSDPANGGTTTITSIDKTYYDTGDEVNIVSTANENYECRGFAVSGTSTYESTNNTLNLKFEDNDIEVIANFKPTTPINPTTYTISLREIDNATISNPIGGRYVSTSHSINNIREGANVSFDITAKPGYKLVSYIIDGNEYQFDNESQSTITVNNVTENKTIDFKISNDEGTVIVLGDYVEKHYRFKIKYKSKNSNEIIIDWKPRVYTYITETI